MLADDVIQLAEDLMWRWVEEGHGYQGSTEACQVLADYAHHLFEQLEASHSALRWIAQEAESGIRDGVLRSAALLRIRDSAYSVVGVSNPATNAEEGA